jgi:hypothetical protein
MLKRLTSCLLMAGAVMAISAHADEVWSTDIGEVVYEADLPNGMAVLSYPTDSNIRGRAFIAGLAGEFTGRTGYEGVWIEADGAAGLCDVAIAAPDTGEKSHNWGRVRVIFVDPDFPSTFVALRGDCFDDPSEMLVARPITAFDE